jgi:D-glucuronyl C5-epimerase C-terminus
LWVVRVAAVPLLALAVLLPTTEAGAARVLALDHGRVIAKDDPYAGRPDLPVPPGPAARVPATPRAVASAKRRTVIGELKRLWREERIDQATYAERRAQYEEARATVRRLSGARRAQLGAVVRTVEDIARRAQLTAGRLPSVFLTLERNRQWWTTGSLPVAGQRVSFQGSELVWQYYAGQGIQLQVLATFGKANALWSVKKGDRLAALLDEMAGLAVPRAGGVAWEYDFFFGGGRPPWTSGLSQGTALQAYSRAAVLLGRADYAQLAEQGLGVFRARPPLGVRADADGGAHYLIYSFAPRLRVLNAFVQSLVGLHDLAELGPSPAAQELFDEGDAAARREVPRYDTGAWSLYSPARESDLGYHKLVRDFLRSLCARTDTDVYCSTAQRFTDYLHEEPSVALVSRRQRGGTRAGLRFRLSKISKVGVTVRRGEKVVFATSATVGRGVRSFSWAVPRRAGAYAVTLSATDLAGNSTRGTGELRVLKPRKRG